MEGRKIRVSRFNQNGRAHIWPGFQLLEQDGHMDMYFCEILHLHKLGKNNWCISCTLYRGINHRLITLRALLGAAASFVFCQPTISSTLCNICFCFVLYLASGAKRWQLKLKYCGTKNNKTSCCQNGFVGLITVSHYYWFGVFMISDTVSKWKEHREWSSSLCGTMM